MGANRQIGWGQESILLHSILKQLEFIGTIASAAGAGGVDPLELNPTNSTAWNNGGGNISSNTSFGSFAFMSNTTGIENTVYGNSGLRFMTSGNQNTTIGVSTGNSITSGTQNTLVGSYTAYLSTSTLLQNTTVGISSMSQRNVTGVGNTSFAGFGLYYLSSGNYNIALGNLSLWDRVTNNTTGSYNIAAGFQSLRNVSSGNNNIGFLLELNDGISSGSRNINFDPRNRPGALANNDNVVFGGIDGIVPALNGQIFIYSGSGASRLAFNSLGEMFIGAAPTNGTGVLTEKVMLIDTVSDVNGMAKIMTVDYIESNGSAAPLSLAVLNATYTTATIGFRVMCVNLGLTYTKTGASTWCSNVSTNVA